MVLVLWILNAEIGNPKHFVLDPCSRRLTSYIERENTKGMPLPAHLLLQLLYGKSRALLYVWYVEPMNYLNLVSRPEERVFQCL